MVVLPYGLADTQATRFPWTSLSIGVLCILIFINSLSQTWATGERQAAGQAVIQYWSEHQYLVPSEEMRSAFETEFNFTRWDLSAAERQQLHRPSESQFALEKKEFARLCEAFAAASDGFIFKWGFVPKRGLLQRGTLTYMFLHGSFAHLLGNLLFFAIVGPAIEGIFGSALFLLFYLLAGALAAAVQMPLTFHPQMPVVGASGAIAGCMGYFMWRFARNRIKMLYLFGFMNGTFRIPAWIGGVAWMLSQVWEFVNGMLYDSNVAVGAHVGGFTVGLIAAAAVQDFRLERKFTPPIHDKEQLLWQKDTELDDAKKQLAGHDVAGAKKRFEAVLERRPNSAEAMWGLCQIRFIEGDAKEGTRLLDRVLTQWLAEKDDAAVSRAVRSVGHLIDVSVLRPSLASRMAAELEGVNPAKAMEFYAVAERAGATKASMRLEQLRKRPLPNPPPPPVETASLPTARVGLVPHLSAAPLATPERITLRYCRLLKAEHDHLLLEPFQEAPFEVSYPQIAKVFLGVISEYQTTEGVRRNVLLTDLAVRTGPHDICIARLPLDQIPLSILYGPSVAPKEAYISFIGYTLQSSLATCTPKLEELMTGRIPRFGTLADFDQASPFARAA